MLITRAITTRAAPDITKVTVNMSHKPITIGRALRRMDIAATTSPTSAGMAPAGIPSWRALRPNPMAGIVGANENQNGRNTCHQRHPPGDFGIARLITLQGQEPIAEEHRADECERQYRH